MQQTVGTEFRFDFNHSIDVVATSSFNRRALIEATFSKDVKLGSVALSKQWRR
jgi:hypothetical protein